jgi:D-aminoacyl-tRNA deacylase
MKIGIVVSKKDEAGMNIRDALMEFFIDSRYKDAKLYVMDIETIYYNENIDADLIIFATKHASKNGLPAFSCHTAGNWGRADLGGKEKDFSMGCAILLKEILRMLQTYSSEREVFQEVSHHGPTIDIPSVFIEIGSGPDEWVIKDNGRKIAEVIKNILDMLEGYDTYYDFIEDYKDQYPEIKVAIAIGGLHHMPNFKDIVVQGNIAIAHTCAKYNLPDLEPETLRKAIEKTAEDVDLVVLDWKGVGKFKESIVSAVKELGLEYKKTKELKFT